MIEVTVDSIRVSLISQHRIVVLKEMGEDRQLPIWIGPFEADAITIGLQSVPISRPLTHDLLGSVVQDLGGDISHIVVSDLEENTFYARIAVNLDGEELEIDCRPSDAIALAVRLELPIYVTEEVMNRVAILPGEGEEPTEETTQLTTEEDLSAFRDFVEGLDFDELDEGEADDADDDEEATGEDEGI